MGKTGFVSAGANLQANFYLDTTGVSGILEIS